MNRCPKKGVLAKVYNERQKQQVVKTYLEAVSFDGTSIKEHPDGIGALKKRRTIHRSYS